MSSTAIQQEIAVLEKVVLERTAQQQILVRDLEVAQQERESADACLEAARVDLDSLPTLNAMFSQSYTELHSLKDQRLLELQVAEAELIAAENALRWQVEEQDEASKKVGAIAEELKERYITAKRSLRMFDPELFRKLEVVESVEAEQRCEIAKVDEALSTIERMTASVVGAQRRAFSATQAGLNDTFREAQDFLCEGNIPIPTAECRISIPAGKLRFLTSSFAHGGNQGFGALRRKFVVHIAVEDGTPLSVLVAGHVNGVRRCVAEIESVLATC